MSSRDPLVPDDKRLARTLSDIQRQLRELGSASPIRHASASDANGHMRIELGAITNPDTSVDTYGMIVRDDTGAVVLVLDHDGLSSGVSAGPLAGLTDVTITSVSDNELLAFDSGSGDWINQTPAAAGLLPTSGGTLTGELITQVVRPSASSTYTLGSSSYLWLKGYFSRLTGFTLEGDIVPSVDSTYDLGDSSKYFAYGYLDHLVIQAGGDISSAGSYVAVADDLIPNADNSRALGYATNRWSSVYANAGYFGSNPSGGTGYFQLGAGQNPMFYGARTSSYGAAIVLRHGDVTNDPYMAWSFRGDLDTTFVDQLKLEHYNGTNYYGIVFFDRSNSQLNSDWVPLTDSLWDLGSTSKYWANLYVDSVTVQTGGSILPAGANVDLGATGSRFRDLFAYQSVDVGDGATGDAFLALDAATGSDPFVGFYEAGTIKYWLQYDSSAGILYLKESSGTNRLRFYNAGGAMVVDNSAGVIPGSDGVIHLGYSTNRWGNINVNAAYIGNAYTSGTYYSEMSVGNYNGYGVRTGTYGPQVALYHGDITGDPRWIMNFRGTSDATYTDFLLFSHYNGTSWAGSLYLGSSHTGGSSYLFTDWVPGANKTYELGEAGRVWNRAYVHDAVLGPWAGGGSYAALSHVSFPSGGYMIMSEGQHTFIGAGTNGDIYLRPNANATTYQVQIQDNGWHVISCVQTAFQGHVRPYSDSTYDLGSSTMYWRELYADGITTAGISQGKGVLDVVSDTSSTTTGVTTTETDVSGSTTAAVSITAGRRYKINWQMLMRSTEAENVVYVRLYRIVGGTPTVVRQYNMRAGGTSEYQTYEGWALYDATSTASHTFKLTIQRGSGSGTLDVLTGTDYPIEIYVEDIGAAV